MTTTLKIAVPVRKAPSPAADAAKLAAQWTEARLVYPIYAAIASQFNLPVPPCKELASPPSQPTEAQIFHGRRWLDDLDQRIQVQQFRQVLQTVHNPSEESLGALALRHLLKQKKTAADCFKIDFLLVQYFVLCAPEEVCTQEIELHEVARVLQPLLGDAAVCPLGWLQPLDNLLEGLRGCRSLRDLRGGGYLEKGREIKDSAGEMFYDPSALVAFVRFNFILRRAIIRLMHADLRAIRETLAQIESCGVKTVDCNEAGLSPQEPTAGLLQLCLDWKQPFTKSYTVSSVGQSFAKLLAIRAAVEQALARTRTPAAVTAAPISRPADPKIPPGKTSKSATTPLAASAPPAPARKASPAPVAQPKLSPRATAAPAAPVATAVAKSAAPPVSAKAGAATADAHPANHADPEACMETIWEQLIAAPPTRGRSMTSVTYSNTKMLLSSWEVAAFISDGGKISEDLRHAVVARLLVAVVMDSIKRSGESAEFDPTLSLAYAEAAKLQESMEQAKEAKNTEAAVNLSITAKRLLAYIEEAKGLHG